MDIVVLLSNAPVRKENPARNLIRVEFSQERMVYIPEESKAVYVSKNGKEKRDFEVLEWSAAMTIYRVVKFLNPLLGGFMDENTLLFFAG